MKANFEEGTRERDLNPRGGRRRKNFLQMNGVHGGCMDVVIVPLDCVENGGSRKRRNRSLCVWDMGIITMKILPVDEARVNELFSDADVGFPGSFKVYDPLQLEVMRDGFIPYVFQWTVN